MLIMSIENDVKVRVTQLDLLLHQYYLNFCQE